MSLSPPLALQPVPPESNPPIEPQFYIPSVFNIAAIALGQTTLVTTTLNHNYVIGQLVRLTIPSLYKTHQLNEKTGYVISIPQADQVVLNIYSQGANTFNPVAPIDTTPPQITAIGDTNSGQINVFGRSGNLTFIPGSFIDVS